MLRFLFAFRRPRPTGRRFPSTLHGLVMGLVAFTLVSTAFGCSEDELYDTASDQVRLRVSLVAQDGTPVETDVSAVPYPNSKDGIVVHAISVGGVAELLIAPGDYTVQVDGGYVTRDGKVSTSRDLYLHHFEAGDDVSLSGTFSGLVLGLRDGATGGWLELEEVPAGSFVFDGRGSFAHTPSLLEDGRLFFRDLADDEYVLAYESAGSEPFAPLTWFPGTGVRSERDTIEVLPGTPAEVEMTLLRRGYLDLSWTTPLPDGFECSYVLNEASGSDELASGVGSRVLIANAPVGEPFQARGEFTWESEGGTFIRTSYLRLPEVVLTPGDTTQFEMAFQGVQVVDTQCGAGCSRRVTANTVGAALSELSYCTGLGMDGRWVLFQAREELSLDLRISLPHGAGFDTYWPGVADAQDRESLVLEDGDSRTVELDALLGGTVRGRVLGPDGEPLYISALRGLTIRVSKPGASVVTVYVEPDGGFSASALRPGDYTISVQTGERSDFVDTWWPNAGTLEEAEVLTLSEGDKVHGLDIRMRRK
ncbi:MAG: carboxypeptidase-like regulatory domain-containing protein [Candidatus Eisenbacteria bacterium]